jgi:muramidase (phage lysozyme)
VTRLVVVDDCGPSIQAFMDMLAFSEIGPALLAESDDGYNIEVGSTASHPVLFASYADHPDVLNRAMDSTAAGRYQFIHATWLAQADPLCLADFSPINQDRACVRLLQVIGAYDALRAGNFDQALRYASTQWASLPYSTAKQPIHTVESLHAIYAKAGGRG